MVKNALQAQLLKAGLVDAKKAKQLNKQTQHAKKTGEQSDQDIKLALAAAQAEKLQKDQQLNQEKQKLLAEKALKANIQHMLSQHQLKDIDGDVAYQFIDQGKVKKIYLNQKIYNQVVAGHVAIARNEQQYPLIPKPLAEKINQRCEGFIVVLNEKQATQVDEDDPYAAYVIPDDLMW